LFLLKEFYDIKRKGKTMKAFHCTKVWRFASMALVVVAVLLLMSEQFQGSVAHSSKKKNTPAHHHLSPGPNKSQFMYKTQPLQRPTNVTSPQSKTSGAVKNKSSLSANYTTLGVRELQGGSPPPSNTGKGTVGDNSSNNKTSTTTSTAASAPTITCTTTRNIDLKVLVIATDGNEPTLPAILQALDYLGTPYTVYRAVATPNGLTADKLASGCHGYYQGVILTNGYLAYNNGTSWLSALSQQEWTTLWSYETVMGVRQLTWYTQPSADFGYQAVESAVDTTATPVNATLTAQGRAVFPYMNAGTSIAIKNAYTYLAKPLADAGATTPILADAQGHALIATHRYADGRLNMALTFDSNPYLLHSTVLSYGLINWLTQGLFLGERHVYMSPQIDDLFIEDDMWQPTTACGTPVEQTGVTYRVNAADMTATLRWQNSKRTQAITRNMTLTMAFNGYGTTPGAYTPDTLTPNIRITQSNYFWVSHTYDHENLDNSTYEAAFAELSQNKQVATNLGLTRFSTTAMVTPDVSGLTNPNFLKAAYDNGIRYLVTDTSKLGYNNPTPNAGIYNPYQTQILMIPRRPNNLFYNVSQPAEWVAEYNCLYRSYWGRALTYQEILEIESDTLMGYMLKGDIDPWMFHQPNLRAYDGVHTLIGDLLDLTLRKYSQYYNLPVQFPQMDGVGQRVAQRMQYNASGVTATIVPGVSITLTAKQAARVPVTGLRSAGAENYGGQSISYVNLAAGQTVTLPLN
jgi:hypothetical protein